jgi:hypothetical protein
MLIISKFHDYYDTALAHGIDKETVYRRETSEIELTEIIPRYRINRNGICRGYVIFSGQEFPFIQLALDDDSNFPFLGKQSFHHIYSLEDLDKLLEKYPSFKESYPALLKEHKNKRSRWQYKYSECVTNRLGIEKHLKSSLNLNLNDAHFKHDSPSLLTLIGSYGTGSYGTRSYKNPILKDIEFFKVKDTFTAFTELSQYISGVMGGRTPKMLEIDDIYRIEAHGFDNKTSFRQMGPKPRKLK